MSVGYPDWTRVIRAEKPSVGAGQAVTVYTIELAVAAGNTSTVTVFTVPSSKRFLLSSAYLSCSASLLQKAEYRPLGIATTMTVIFDTNFQLIDSDIGAAVFEAGQTLDIRFTNNDSVERTFYMTIWGDEEDA